ncbi:Putative (Uracil-5)-methyltransferase family, nucleic acid-binding, RNA methyltransferase TrmA [Colletotrichum destructivum]|uniref:tRNA (uracil(54)-C(5))-methyltransferase n=1 Tax=Colletotrichum destructivum TaxID=34406 RepID=A0AAX4IF75_9PEZI|nr:Putative (Uracil-5)-methyltransferase family, nucleic acid-binding, RNA methyltransferase TrmA [Colletotrichum destructivum]
MSWSLRLLPRLTSSYSSLRPAVITLIGPGRAYYASAAPLHPLIRKIRMSSNTDTPQPAQAPQQGQGHVQGLEQKKWQSNNGGRPNGNKRGFQGQGQGGRGKDKQRKSKRERNITEGSSEEVLAADVQALIASRKESLPEPAAAAGAADAGTGTGTEVKEGDAEAEAETAAETQTQTQTQPPSQPALPAPFTEIEVEVLALSSTGDGLAVHAGSPPTQIYVVPFVAPGDIAKVKVIRHFPAESYSMADYLSVVTPGPLRDDTRVNCKYFTQCSGCQFQMLSYDTQLAHKRTIVEKAFRNFSNLDPSLVPDVAETIGSPLQYGYRTKLTPHFDGPPGHHKRNKPRQALDRVPDIGFNVKGRRAVLDIEDCPIGTDAVRLGMKRERARIARDYGTYTKGATILLRESTKRYPKKVIGGGDGNAAATTAEGQPETEPEQQQPPAETPSDAIRIDTDTHTDIKTCISEPGAMSTEYIGRYLFTNPANSFFQNNNSILPTFTGYIRDRVMPPAGPNRDRIKYLIDAYSGSGLFTITLASLFRGSTGIDIAKDSIECARKNARLNDLPESQCNFMAADAPQLFAHVTYPADETVVVIDPPRKGCDNDFLSQLLRYGPRRVVYVSCNVHTQARDVGVLVRGDGGDGTRYDIESLVGFDFFPQTGHVEGVAVLNRVEKAA